MAPGAEPSLRRRGARCWPWLAALLLLVTACFAPTPAQRQRRRARAMRPKPFVTGPAQPGLARTLKVRAYADQGHQEAILGWQARVYRLVTRINPVLRSTLGVELEIISARPWARDNVLGGLPAALADLERFDAGEDVDLVLGLTTPLARLVLDQLNLGRARVLGRHIVIRPGDDAGEVDRLERTFPLIGVDERRELYKALRNHREDMVLLHELGHALGALHVVDDDRVMSPTISRNAVSFTPQNLQLMRIVVQARGDGRRGPETWTETLAAYREALASATSDVWAPESRARLLSALRGGPSRLERLTQQDLEPAMGRRRQRGPVDDESRAARAAQIAGEDPEAAWALLAPVLARHPGDRAMQGLGCQVALRRAPAAAETVAQCTRAVRLAPGAAGPLLWRANARLQRAETAGALEDARAAEAHLTRTSTGAPDEWAALTSLYQGLRAVTWAERAAARSADQALAAQTKAWATRLRQRHGLPRDAAERGVPPDEEPAYLGLRAQLGVAAAERDEARVRALEAELKRRYPRLGASAAGCRLLVERRDWGRAYPACRRAARAFEKNADVQTLAAVAAFGAGRPAAAVPPLERAVRLAPERTDAWRLLATAYEVSGRNAELRKLKARYRRRFGEPLR